MSDLDKWLEEGESDAEILERAGKAAVWEKLHLFFDSMPREVDDHDKFIREWAEAKLKTHGPFLAKMESARTRVAKQREIIRVMREALNDADNHWHHPKEKPWEEGHRRCTACDAIAEVERIAKGET